MKEGRKEGYEGRLLRKVMKIGYEAMELQGTEGWKEGMLGRKEGRKEGR